MHQIILPHQLSLLLPCGIYSSKRHMPGVCHAMARVSAKDLPVHSAMLSVHLFFGLPILRVPSTVPCSITLVRPSDIVTCAYHFRVWRFTVARRSSYGFLHILVMVPIHDTIRSCGACRLPCTSANHKVWHVSRYPGRWKSEYFELQPVLFYSRFWRTCWAIIQSERWKHLRRPSPYSNTRRSGWHVWMHRNAPILRRNICVSSNMEFFCRTNIKPRYALPVMLDCSQYGGSRFKKYRRCHGLCV